MEAELNNENIKLIINDNYDLFESVLDLKKLILIFAVKFNFTYTVFFFLINNMDSHKIYTALNYLAANFSFNEVSKITQLMLLPLTRVAELLH